MGNHQGAFKRLSGFLDANVADHNKENKCDRILENHSYGHILNTKYLVLKSSLKFFFFVHLWFQYSKNALNYKKKYKNN